VKVALRVIAATNKDLPARVDHGVFREDLYYRLKVVEIALPPLRERREDIPLLVDHFIRMFNEKFGKHIEAVSEDVLRIFMLDPWPGNVRQLAHTLEHAFVLCDRNVVTADDLPFDFRRPYDSRAVFDLREHRGCEPQAILRALRKSSWNKAGAARLLGISRQTLYRKMLEHEIAPESQDDSCNMLHD
jgi:two-component system response regulator HydG